MYSDVQGERCIVRVPSDIHSMHFWPRVTDDIVPSHTGIVKSWMFIRWSHSKKLPRYWYMYSTRWEPKQMYTGSATIARYYDPSIYCSNARLTLICCIYITVYYHYLLLSILESHDVVSWLYERYNIRRGVDFGWNQSGSFPQSWRLLVFWTSNSC